MQAFTYKKMMNIKANMMLFCLFGFGVLLSTNHANAADANPFAKHYKEQNTNNLKSMDSNPDTKIYVSNHKDDDNISMLENGYDMIGSSGFSATETSADFALAHAKSIKADTVLVYRKYESAATSSSKFELIKEAAKNGGEIDPNDLKEGPTQYHYYASYWAKLPMPLLGVHVIKLQMQTSDEGRDVLKEEAGLKLLAVIKESPAFKAGLVKGDTLLKIADVELSKSDDLFAAVKRYAGQTVIVKLQRNGADLELPVTLNSRK